MRRYLLKEQAADCWWRQPRDVTPAEVQAEQDYAAGGREMRLLRLAPNRVVTASVGLKTFKTNYQLYGYLRYQDGPKTVSVYLGNVVSESREESLALGWRLAREPKVLRGRRVNWVNRGL